MVTEFKYRGHDVRVETKALNALWIYLDGTFYAEKVTSFRDIPNDRDWIAGAVTHILEKDGI